MNKGSLIVALDFPSVEQALAMADRLDSARCRVKVGKELFTRGGPKVVQALVERGFEVFLDLKFHDIPNTVAAACRAAADLGVWMINVHAFGGRKMMAAARGALEGLQNPPLLIAVTVLTSLDTDDLAEVGISSTPEQMVLRLARLAQESGMDGVVCSARELAPLRAALPAEFLTVTPGIRPRGAAVADQKRVMSPADAIQAGASYLVVGRPVTAAKQPRQALTAIEAEIAGISA